ncbi:hypothetical protein GIB67_020669, partial [Kingdonia uniflora]
KKILSLFPLSPQRRIVIGELLEDTLKQDLIPFSWTNCLYLSICDTLSNARNSGQIFKYGSLINNVL